MPINILNSLQKSIKRFRKERVRNAKKMRKTNIVLSTVPPASKVKQLMLTRRQQHKQNIKLGVDLKNSLEKFLKEEGKKAKKILVSKTRASKRRVKRSSRGRGKKTQRRSRTQKNRRRSRTQKNRRRSRTQKNRRAHR